MSITTAGAPLSKRLRDDAGITGLVGLGHLVSHFSQLLLAPLFPWLKEAFDASYTQLGFLMTLFFAVSCGVQTAAGFLVDRHGPRPILFGGLALLGFATFGFALSPSYWVMAFFAVVAGVGNGVFHPADYTLLNRKVSAPRLGHAYSFHGITGSLGWALAPAAVVPLAIAFSWRVALMSAGTLAFIVLGILFWYRDRLALAPVAAKPVQAAAAGADGKLDFLRIPAVWMCFGFFFFYAWVLSAVQAFAPEAARQLHGVPVAMAAMCLTAYMVCSAGGMVLGGFFAVNPERCEFVVGIGFAVAALIALGIAIAPMPAVAVPVLFGLMGLVTGAAAPSRDLLVKKSTPENATGRVYGVVYSGLDIGQAVSPLIFGALMDQRQYQGVWLGLALVQAVLIGGALKLRRVPRTRLASA
jgi:FSR family fosmidomycin resistance protein-like MFS transporter